MGTIVASPRPARDLTRPIGVFDGRIALMRLLLSHDDLDRWAPGREGVMSPQALALAYAYPRLSGTQTWVRANFVSTLDGVATGDDGRSSSINTGADREVFQLLRALSDVILIGAGTARVEGYRRPTVRGPWLELREGRPAHPTMAVVTRSAGIPPRLSQDRENSGELLLITCNRAGAEAIDLARATLGVEHVIVVGDATVDLAAAMDALAARGLSRILCEGGPHLMRDLTASGRLDELCLTLVPMLLAGDHTRITAGAPVTANLLPRLLIESEGTLLGRWVRP
jgi:riboflavin biosynthesis pyrimidine reductase